MEEKQMLTVSIEEVCNLIDIYWWKNPKIISNNVTNCAKVKSIDTRELLKYIVTTEKSLSCVGFKYGISEAALSLRMKKVVEIPREGNSKYWVKILEFFDLQKCCTCKEILYTEFFHNCSSRKRGIKTECKSCSKSRYVKWEKENPLWQEKWRKDYYKPGTKNHKQKLLRTQEWRVKNNYSTKKGKDRRLRRPSYANVEKMVDIYKNCPEGYHVDHIIPLKGRFVSGFDIETNLQYLSSEENLKKSNKFIPCDIENIPKGLA